MIEAATFRQVLGTYPTGVCAITAITGDAVRTAMVVGSFTSVSLDPPLIGFFPDKKSTSWPQIEKAGHFCVNVLASDQRDLCRQLSVSGTDKFENVHYTLSDNGAPVLDGAIAWIDCRIHDVKEVGDHYLVLGLVLALKAGRDADPMLFFKGGYGGFAGAKNQSAS